MDLFLIKKTLTHFKGYLSWRELSTNTSTTCCAFCILFEPI